MDRRSFCVGAAALLPVTAPAVSKGATRPPLRLQSRTLEGLGRLGPNASAFVTHYLENYQPSTRLWGYEDGVVWTGVLALYEATGDRAFLDYVLGDMATRVTPDGKLPSFQPLPHNIDMIKAGSNLLPLYRMTGEARFRLAMDTQFSPLKTFPRTKTGNYWHKARYPWQVWLDGLYMGQPFQLQYARVTGDAALAADSIRQFRTVERVMKEPRTGLYYHGWDESRQQRWADKQTGLSPHIWGRAMGWWLCALVDSYEWSEGFDPRGRRDLARMLRGSLDAMLAHRSRSGVWYQIVDQGTRAGNYKEASATMMTTYALLKAARLGVVGEETRQEGLKTLAAASARFVTPTAVNGICSVAGLGGDPYRDGSYEYYLSEKVVSNDPKGVGAYFMSLAEAWRADPANARRPAA